ncbi:metal-sulfur cluster assembly factor [Apilactobacillus kunkeei]|uniref:Metal-sulfur cluster biosynthetic enzyme n=1 Tax=Apilactobacillus kunkeei TaxID=148814 RepID=A0A0M9DGK3_9LACO|nr:metal-sulfur cluster assembly factor [Apilactobacillus kunkeei]KOY79746.1 Metal-sulfur cluster biosynthetic enzyme [Apilactobacillus kunkeei]
MEIKRNKYIDALESVIDPELYIDIVNLGLIYRVEVDDNKKCVVTMTLTIMGCPLSDYLFDQIKEQLIGFEEIDDVKVNLIFEPAWTIDNMSREARLQLGIH